MSQANAGFYHIKVGDIIVTALNDGLFEASTGFLLGIEPEEAEAALLAGCRTVPPLFTVNAFLIQTGSHVALVDTGASKVMGPTLGLLPDRLAAIGVDAAAIDTVLLTHLHGDHIAGLADADGAAVFPNAKLVMSAAEAGFWLDEETAAKAPDAAKSSFALAGKMTAPYRDRITLATEGDVLPGVAITALPGHTPGHSGFLVSSGGASLLIWGDIVHVPSIQFARPEVGLRFDSDPALANTTRDRALDMAATDKIMVAGMHLDFPAFGNVVRAGSAYAFVPAQWQA
jgi:glyoxylase-like metal-dependent hydrolase (beta-lactamase superfamily II)